MVEPTESEDLAELDRFCDAMIAIETIRAVERGEWSVDASPLRGAPRTRGRRGHRRLGPRVLARRGRVPRRQGELGDKYWPPVGRIDGAYGDRNLMCSCPPLSEYEHD